MGLRGERLLQNETKYGIIKADKSLTPKDIAAINAALAANLRVEIVVTDKGVKLYHVKRKELNRLPVARASAQKSQKAVELFGRSE